jgi:hypothetical protein
MPPRRRPSPFATVAAAAFLAAAAGQAALAQQATDICANAPLISTGTFTGTTTGATTDGSADCDFGTTAPDVWYRITPAEDATLVLNMCASTYDTVVSLHTGCPGNDANQVACNDQSCGNQSVLTSDVTGGQTYLIRVSGWNNQSGYQEPPPPGSGPDVVYQAIQSNDIGNYGPVGGVRAYIYATGTCNAGNVNLLWTNDGTPGVGFNAYRLQGGRLVQLGQSWVKTACCAATFGSCGGRVCNGASGTQLGSGCLDIYGSGFNASQGSLMARSQINAWTGQFGSLSGSGSSTIDRRCQVSVSEVSPTTYPGSIFIAEGVYVADDEGVEAKMNNASHQVVSISSTGVMATIGGLTMQAGEPAIQAWQDHGLGVNTPDPSVVIQTADVPDEGRFYVGHKVSDNGDGTWRYEYAVFNLNSHRSGGSFSVPLSSGATVSNVGFHDVSYHSGEPYDNTDWNSSVTADAVSWTSPQTFAQNPNSNALRWGTMYNFWFDADVPPAEADATLGLFRTGTPDSIAVMVGTPTGGGTDCAADWNADETVNSSDISAFLTAWLESVQMGNLVADFNADEQVNSNDISSFLTAWLDAVQNGC